MNEEEKKIIETINDYIKKKEELGDLGDDFTINFRDAKPLKILLNLIEKQQEEIEDLEERNRIKNSLNGAKMSKFLINIGRKVGITEIAISESMILEAIDNKFVSKNKIIERIKELEEQQETLKYDGNVCFADYEQFCKNLKFLKEQIKELLEEN